MRLLSFLLLLASTAVAQVPSGWVTIVNDKSNTCLDMTGGPTATGSGVQAQIWTCLGSNQTNQSFKLVPVTGGTKSRRKVAGFPWALRAALQLTRRRSFKRLSVPRINIKFGR